jgi:hypothetical protein
MLHRLVYLSDIFLPSYGCLLYNNVWLFAIQRVSGGCMRGWVGAGMGDLMTCNRMHACAGICVHASVRVMHGCVCMWGEMCIVVWASM